LAAPKNKKSLISSFFEGPDERSDFGISGRQLAAGSWRVVGGGKNKDKLPTFRGFLLCVFPCFV
jgi:hypothetical protein